MKLNDSYCFLIRVCNSWMCNDLTFLSFTLAMAFFNNILAFLYLASRSSSDTSLVLSSHAFSLFFCLRSILRELLNANRRRILFCRLNLGNGNDFFTKPPPILQYLQNNLNCLLNDFKYIKITFYILNIYIKANDKND